MSADPTLDLSPASPDQAARQSFISHGLINACVKTGDAICLALAALVASAATTPITLAQSLLMSLLAIYPYRMVSGNRRVYRWDRYHSLGWEILDILVGLTAGAGAIWIFIEIFHPLHDTTPWFLTWIVTALASVMVLRLGIRGYVNRLRRRGVLVHRVAVIGAGAEGAAVVEHLIEKRLRDNQYEIIGVFDERADRRGTKIHGIPVIKGIDPLVEISRTTQIDAIVVALPVGARDRISTMMQKINSIPTDILLLMEMNWLNVREIQLRNVDGYSFLQVARRPLIGSRALLKAIEDYSVAAVAIVLAAPVMLAVAIAIRLEGPGPILFRQSRVGFNHREFNMLKFRSMALDPHDDGTRGTLENDPRVTRVGRFIRRTSLDELPQLFNVLRGEMSIVGPRAHVPKMLVGNQIYPEAVIEYAARHRVKPGITGWAQINGMRGGIHTEAKARRGVELDLEYIESWSPLLDLVIMTRTILGGLWGRNVF
jgi:putative colanic acid biosynthesis UDP-glucose lipid carrier transferase